MSKNEFNNAILNVSDDISKCEEFLCRVLNARVEKPFDLDALQSSVDKHTHMANNRQTYVPPTYGSRAQKIRNLTPPVKLSRGGAVKHLEATGERNKRNAEKTSHSRSPSSCSERSNKPSAPTIDEEVDNDRSMEDMDPNMERGNHKSTTHMVSSRQSWSQLLAGNRKASTQRLIHSANMLPGTFSQFDPLRTLHFLTKELQTKLYSITPEATTVHRIVSEIQQSLHRLPVPCSEHIPGANQYADMAAYLGQPILPSGVACQVSQTSAIAVVHQQMQTDDNIEATQQLQKELELSCLKLELNCKNLNEACSMANSERDEMRETVKTLKTNNLLLQTEIEELKKHPKTETISANAEKMIEELRMQNLKLQSEKEAINNEKQFRVAMLEDKITKLKKTKDEEYSTYMSMKLELDKKNAIITAKDQQLQTLTKELNRVQDMVKMHLCEQESNAPRTTYSKSIQRITKSRDLKGSTPASSLISLSTFADSVVTRSPSREKYSTMSKPSKADHFGINFLSKSFENKLKDRSSSKDIKASQHDSRYSINRRFHDRKHRPGSPKEQESKLTVTDSLRLDKAHDDTDGGSQGDMATVADIFNDIRNEVLKTANVTLPSPPRKYNLPDVTSSQSQWSDST